MIIISIDLLLAWGAAFKKVSIGETIFSEGHACSFYYQLVSGQVKWEDIDDQGKECIQLLINPGESFGEFPLFDNRLYAANAVAVTDCILIRLDRSAFLELLKENSHLLFNFTELFSKRLRFKFAIVKSFASHCPEVMISALLDYFKTENKGHFINGNQLNLTRQQIADMTGLRVETVIRTMRNMHDRGDFVIRKGKVYCP